MPEENSAAIVPDGYGTVTPWLISYDSVGLIRFLEAAFGAVVDALREQHERHD